MESHVVVHVTCPSRAEAEELSKKIMEQRLAACINVISGVQSYFYDENVLKQEKESLMILKTKRELVDSLTSFVIMHHSFEVPEVIALPIIGGSNDYLNWIGAQTTGS